MSLELLCPNCGAQVGTADQEDGYEQWVVHVDKNGDPDCNNCHANFSAKIENWMIRMVLIIFGTTILVFIGKAIYEIIIAI